MQMLENTHKQENVDTFERAAIEFVRSNQILPRFCRENLQQKPSLVLLHFSELY
jgi:hypothetical protein